MLMEVQQPHSHFSGSGDERRELLPSERYCADLNDDHKESCNNDESKLGGKELVHTVIEKWYK